MANVVERGRETGSRHVASPGSAATAAGPGVLERLDPAILARLPLDFQRAIEFHGHLCPGLTIGYRAATIAMNRLGVAKGTDEELLAVVETDACGADAIQVITGCTFGRGNFVFKDYGKQVFTVYSRAQGIGWRVAMRGGVLTANPQHQALFQKVARGEATPEERQLFQQAHLARALAILDLPDEVFADIRQVELPPIPKARIFPSVQCSVCGENVMEPRARVKDGKFVCIPCAEKYGRGWEING